MVNSGFSTLNTLKDVVSVFLFLSAALLPAGASFAADGAGYALPRSAVYEVSQGDRSYRIYVSVPPGYSLPENLNRKYPAIYLNDAELFFAFAAGAPLLSYYNGALEETIIIGISYAIGENPLASRQRDLTPVRDDVIAKHTGGAGDYLEMMKLKAIPTVDAAYRVDPARRTLAGHSFGAIFGLYVLLTEPEIFSNYILVSPSLWYGDYAAARNEEEYAQHGGDLQAKVYLAVGDLESPAGGLVKFNMVDDATAFAARLRSRNYQGFILKDEVLSSGVTHATSFQFAYLRALEWMFAPD